jgi:hypothetical protein
MDSLSGSLAYAFAASGLLLHIRALVRAISSWVKTYSVSIVLEKEIKILFF